MQIVIEISDYMTKKKLLLAYSENFSPKQNFIFQESQSVKKQIIPDTTHFFLLLYYGSKRFHQKRGEICPSGTGLLDILEA